MNMVWKGLHPQMTPERLGYLPHMFSDLNPKPVRDQFLQNYPGWRPFEGFRLSGDGLSLLYPGDPPVKALAEAKCRDETVRLFEHDWVAIVQPDGSFEVARMA